MSTREYLLRRIVQSFFVLLGLSFLIFVIGRVVPGDPARLALGPRAPEWAVQNLREQMHLDRPLLVQYGMWLRGLTRGDLGMSLLTRRPVTEDIMEFLPATLEIVLISAIILAVFGIALGILSAKYADTWLDSIIRVFSYLGIVTPSFVWAIIFLLAFGYRAQVLPTAGRISAHLSAPPTITGMYVLDGLLSGNFEVAWDCLSHLILPSVALAMGGLSQAARITRSSMTDNVNKEYILAATAYGVPDRRVFSKHLLKPSLIPTVSVMALDIAMLFANAFLVELLFNYPGLSRYGTQAMLNKDLNAISAVIMVLGLVFVIVNIAIDFIVVRLDPRTGLGGGSV